MGWRYQQWHWKACPVITARGKSIPKTISEATRQTAITLFPATLFVLTCFCWILREEALVTQHGCQDNGRHSTTVCLCSVHLTPGSPKQPSETFKTWPVFKEIVFLSKVTMCAEISITISCVINLIIVNCNIIWIYVYAYRFNNVLWSMWHQ